MTRLSRSFPMGITRLVTTRVTTLIITLAAALTLLLASPALVAPLHAQYVGVAPDVAQILRQIKTADRDELAVSEEDGRFLRLMAASSRATHALEIGGAHGYSAIWIGLGLRETGGTLTSIEYDPQRARVAAENIRRAGLSDIVTVVPGDAFKQIPMLTGTFDFVFLDAWKRDYKRFYDLVLPRLNPRGLFLAHNVVNKQAEMRDFLGAIQNDPAVLTTIVAPSGEGISVTYKRAGGTKAAGGNKGDVRR